MIFAAFCFLIAGFMFGFVAYGTSPEVQIIPIIISIICAIAAAICVLLS